MGKAAIAAQQKISKLDLEIAEHDNAVSDLNTQRLEIEQKRASLLGARCDLLSTTIFSDLEKLLISYLKVQETYKAFRGKIIEFGEHKPTLYERAKTEGKHDFWLVVADGCLKPGDMRDYDFGSFMKKLLLLTRDMTNKEDFPFPGLKGN